MSISTRDNYWLVTRLNFLWSNYFSNIQKENPIMIKFGRHSRFRLGSIKLHRHSGFSMITITGMFRDHKVLTEVVDHTIAHELIHYVQGFSSKKTRLHRYPHAGGVVRKEMLERGMGHLNTAYNKWVKEYKTKLIDG